MDKSLIEKYMQEMLQMRSRAVAANSMQAQQPQPQTQPKPTIENNLGQNGGIVGDVTTIRSLYPLPNAKFTVFTGDADNMQIVDEDVTDESGKTKLFILETPNKSISLESGNTEIPYSLYNVRISADGYVDNIHLNVPVFSGVVSLVKSNMMLQETAGVNKGPQIFDEFPSFNL